MMVPKLVLTDANEDQVNQLYPDVDYYDLMEWGFENLVKVSIEALKEEELEPLPEEEDWT